jgi:hypothetical protein
MNMMDVFPKVISCILLLQMILSAPVQACKDIIACGDATEGEYNLLLKVRDPSRPGYQVLCMVPEGYEYTYHHPWTGKNISFTSSCSYIGVTSVDDIPPSIVKAGMTLTDTGLAFGDADSLSRWINPTIYAWDDFDWIRYACEQATTTQEAVDLLTTDVVDTMCAPGVSENLFVVGPEDGYLIEADAFRYHIKQITNGYDVISNYPRELWKTQYVKTLPIASSFDTENEKVISKGNTMRLNSILGIRLCDVGDNWITVKQIPFFTFIIYENGKPIILTEPIKIMLGERKTVGDYSITLLEVQDLKARVHVETVHHAWQRKMEDIIDQRYGTITLLDMMNWSRLNESMLDGLRPMCEPKFVYEGSAIYKIPTQYSSVLGNGWFAANHAHSSIFVPFHNCNTDILTPYETGEVACLCSQLSQTYFDTLLPAIQRVESVFLHENQMIEDRAVHFLNEGTDVSAILTLSDISMQHQAWLMLQIFHEIRTCTDMDQQKNMLSMLEDIYFDDYSNSLPHIKDALIRMQTEQCWESSQELLTLVLKDICHLPIELCKATNRTYIDAEELFKQGELCLSNGQYDEAFQLLASSFHVAYGRFYDQE